MPKKDARSLSLSLRLSRGALDHLFKSVSERVLPAFGIHLGRQIAFGYGLGCSGHGLDIRHHFLKGGGQYAYLVRLSMNEPSTSSMSPAAIFFGALRHAVKGAYDRPYHSDGHDYGRKYRGYGYDHEQNVRLRRSFRKRVCRNAEVHAHPVLDLLHNARSSRY